MLSRKRLPEAEAAYLRVIELTPDNTRGYNNLGVTYLRMQRTTDAVRQWERSIAIRPTFSAASNLGRLLLPGGPLYGLGARVRARGRALAERLAALA